MEFTKKSSFDFSIKHTVVKAPLRPVQGDPRPLGSVRDLVTK